MTRPERWEDENELVLTREACRRNFWYFFTHAFGALKNPKGLRWIDPAIHKPIADWFQGHIEQWDDARRKRIPMQKHLAIVVHREVGKTTLITQAGQLWLHLRDPEISSYTGGESLQLSMKTLGSIKAVLDGSDPYADFTRLFGDWSGSARTWAGREIVHNARKNTARRDPSFGTFAVETSIVGSHPDAIFYDDPISIERLASDSDWLKTVNDQVTALYPVIQGDGLVVFVGTRYGADDHFGTVFEEEGVQTLSGMQTDSIVPNPSGKWHVYFMAGRDAEGQPSTPKVWPSNRLEFFERRDALRFATQIMNDPNVSETNPITVDQLNQCLIDEKDVPWAALRFAVTTDTAFWDGKTIHGKDETVYQVWGYPRDGSGIVYFIEGYSSPTWRAEDFARRIVALVQRYRSKGLKIFAITDEVTMAGKKGAWLISFRNYFSDANEPMPNFIEFNRGGTRKLERIRSACTFWVNGCVKVVKGAPGMSSLMDQMAKIGQFDLNPRLKKDWADAAADVFQPELYQPVRRMNMQPPWRKGGDILPTPGLNRRDFQDNQWEDECPREPLK